MNTRALSPAIVLFLLYVGEKGIFVKNSESFLSGREKISFESCNLKRNLCFINKRIRPPPAREVKK